MAGYGLAGYKNGENQETYEKNAWGFHDENLSRIRKSILRLLPVLLYHEIVQLSRRNAL